MCDQSRPESIPELMNLAISHHRGGRLREAAAHYEQILQLEPEHADALNLSGLVAFRTGHSELAIALITRATTKNPGAASYFFNLGLVFEERSEWDEAIAHYQRAALLDPLLPSVHNSLGRMLLKQGKFREAAQSYSRELNARPDSHEAASNLGLALHHLGRHEQAIVCYKKALTLEGDHAGAHNNMGMTLDFLDRWDEAIASYQQAILYNPTFAEAYSNLGKTLTTIGHYEQAVQCCQTAVELKPDYHIGYLNLGNAYKELGLLSDAVRSYQRVLSLSPNFAGAHSNLAMTFKDQGKLQEAVDSFQRALDARPVFTSAYSNLLYFYAFTSHIPPAEQRIVAEGWEKAFLTGNERAAARKRAPAGAGTFPVRSRIGRKLRLGIVSAELGQHSVAEFLEPFLEQLDRDRIDLTLFPTKWFPDMRGQRFRALAESNGDDFIPLFGVPDAEAAERIRSQQIDVLVESSGHTHANRLGIMAHRAAPVQCSYIGYWSTTGLTEMDWFITSSGIDACCDAHFTEGLWRLSHFGYCYKGDWSLPEGAWAPDPEGTVWLGSFNNYAKIREETLGLWAKVLHALPEARLLFADRAAHEEETHRRISSTLSGLGIGESRIAFVPYVAGHERHMMLYARLDIALDTIPFNSGTTAYDALWMGVPLVTLEGNWLGGSTSLVVRALDHPEWVAHDAEEYVSIVCSLARDLEGRKALRRRQRSRMAESPMCDAEGLARALEDALELMYDLWIGAAANLAGEKASS